ncbi:uncharacterized protein LOC141659291 [Apium graveolens]|uniref:uncharacterized protein LOC141659291 n=1 Tax=Apium graveolens TaxID=4045 RepID=UPI003D79B2E4
MHELGSKFNPLIFDDLEWTNEWIDDVEDRFWSAVDTASGASESLGGRKLPRKAKGGSKSDDVLTYTRCGTSSTQVTQQEDDDDDDDDDEWGEDEDNTPNDDEDVEDDYGVPPDPSNKNTQEDGHDFEMDDYF